MEKEEEIQKENEEKIKKFEKFLIKNGLSQRTINNHVSNVDMLINQYLSYEELRPEEIDEFFLDSFFMWCVEKWIYNTAAGFSSAFPSILIFYEHLNKENKVKNIKDVFKVCRKRDFYLEEYNSHEKLLDEEW